MTSSKYWLTLLLSFLRPAVDGDDDTQNLDADKSPGGEDKTDAGAEDDQLDLALDDSGEDDKTKVDPKDEELSRAKQEAKEARERAERFEREATEARIRSTPKPDDNLEAQENVRLNDPQVSELEKWQIKSNRTLRQNAQASQLALHQAQDVSDRTDYTSLAMSNPVAKKYEARVEEELVKARRAGMNPSRRGILKHLLGEDMLQGKFTKAKKTAPADDKTKVNRGRLPGAKSDVSGKGTQSEHEKRRARLQDVQI